MIMVVVVGMEEIVFPINVGRDMIVGLMLGIPCHTDGFLQTKKNKTSSNKRAGLYKTYTYEK
ncbi:hypothetical protein GCM10010831_13740 [Psychroflexus salis]|uniref:Uncharacterized protein n=1 Tax=Psychroflexus salis TaxID=1526574 RepID=A0A916ZTQ8_9FLAO|nr:hypothetical protein GCM10010831_13740 [Psychroflexus salis]